MAHNEDKKLEVRAYYETHYDNSSKVAKRFGVNGRTLRHWIKDEGWEVGRLEKVERLKEDLKNGNTKDIRNELKEELKKELGIGQGKDLLASVVRDDLIGNTVDDLILRAMAVEYLDEELIKTMLLAKGIFHNLVADNLGDPDNLKYAKDYAGLVMDAKRSIHGKEPQNLIQIANINNIKGEEMGSLSDDDLRRIVEIESKGDR